MVGTRASDVAPTERKDVLHLLVHQTLLVGDAFLGTTLTPLHEVWTVLNP